jgi:hypothetical protein
MKFSGVPSSFEIVRQVPSAQICRRSATMTCMPGGRLGSMKLPDRTSTVPSARVVAVGYHRRTSSPAGVVIGAIGVQVFAAASYRQAWLRPSPSA